MPTQIGVGSQGVWSPFFAQNGKAFGAGLANMRTEQANMTYVPNATLAHPYYTATSNPNPHWMKIDMNTTGVTVIGGVGDADLIITPPDNTRRWGHVLRFLFYKDGNVTSKAKWLATTGVSINTDGTVEVTATGAGVYTSSAIPTNSGGNTGVEVEIWFIPKDASGANLLGSAGHLAVQCVIRVNTDPGNTPAHTTILNVLMEGASAVTKSHLPMEVGDMSARGAVNFYYSNIYGPNWEDADAPYGAVRVEEYIPTADYAGHDGFSGTYADWDEAAPDDATTLQVAAPSGTVDNETETVANGAGGTSGVTSSDAVICMTEVIRATQATNDTKGASVAFYASQHDGTTLAKLASAPEGAGVYGYRSRFWRTDASGVAWAQAALANIKIGAAYDTVVGTPASRYFSAVRGYVAWVKSGEEYAAVPAMVPAVSTARSWGMIL